MDGTYLVWYRLDDTACIPCSIKLNKIIASISKTVFVVVDGRTVITRELSSVLCQWYGFWFEIMFPHPLSNSLLFDHQKTYRSIFANHNYSDNREQPWTTANRMQAWEIKRVSSVYIHQNGYAKYSTWYTVRNEQYLSEDLVMAHLG